MRRVQVPFGKELGPADREKWKNQSGISIFPTGLTPVGLMISSCRIGPPGGYSMPCMKYPG
jgi:hypothetical protein